MEKKPYYVELNTTIRAMDIHSMSDLDDESYREMVTAQLFYVDPHENLRDAVTDHPIATSLEQLDILIEELGNMRSRMISKNN
ncbi:hypothetical protein [Vibrio parahaemolyticus]|uniref:hypothetical protein n=1 Tax=Vibrio parahaemolyticus TaxID=670 RepID=UPI0004A2A3E3|nr:hypothetical protein [Vibrio parahaemolyticus]MCC3818166.1 hypothetical protein [Vibrio parahaemolyticus]